MKKKTILKVCLSGTTGEQGVPTDRLCCYIKHKLNKSNFNAGYKEKQKKKKTQL